jgi:hypothetical protein
MIGHFIMILTGVMKVAALSQNTVEHVPVLITLIKQSVKITSVGTNVEM